jgi:hypothetical protein
VSSVGLGSGVGKHRVIAWGNQSQGFGVHASAASVGDLGIASSEMPHLGLAVTLAQSVVLPVANATQGHLAENIYNLGVANAIQGHTVAAPGQTQLQILVVVSDEQGHTATPNILVKNLVGVGAEMPHEATPDTLAKNVLMANAILGHEGTALQMTLTVDSATMGHNGLAVEFPVGGAANLTVVAGTMPHDGLGVEGFSPTQLADLKLWLAPESGVVVSATNFIEQWNDKSGLGNHAVQPISANMPRHVSALADLNSHNAVRFNNPVGAMRLYATNAGAVSAVAASGLSQTSGVIVFESSAPTLGQVLYQAGLASANTDFRRLSLNAGRYRIQEAIVGVASAADTSVSAKATPVVFRWSWASGRVHAWENGAAALTDAVVSAGSNAAIGATPHISLGSDPGGGNIFFGHVAEVIVASTVWSSSQGRELDKLLGAKYGIDILWAQPVQMANAELGHTVAAPELFSPDSQQDLYFWYAPESGVTVSGARVEQWNDKSGRGNHMTQAVSAAMPVRTSAVVNNHNVLRFNGLTAYLANYGADVATLHLLDHPFAIAVVAARTSAPIASSNVLVGIGTTASTTEFSLIEIQSRQWRLRRNDGAAQTDDLVSANGGFHVHLLNVLGTAYQYFQDGVAVCAAGTMDMADFVSANVLSLGALVRSTNETGVAFLDGDVAELLVYATAMTSSHGRELNKLLGAKYGITIT